MIRILRDGTRIQIDEETEELLRAYDFTLYARRSRETARVAAFVGHGADRQEIQLARLVLDCRSDETAHHKNGDLLDLRRDNLEAVRNPYKRPCPLDTETLRRMYVDENQSTDTIARAGSLVAGWEPPVTGKVAQRWLKEAGIALVTKAQHAARIGHIHGAKNAVKARQALKAAREAGLVTNPKGTFGDKAVHQKALEASLKTRIGAKQAARAEACQDAS